MVRARSSNHDQTPAAVGLETLHLIQNHGNFSKSSKPVRIMHYFNGDWLDFTQETLTHLATAFFVNIPAVELNIDGVTHVIDFFRMLLTDLSTGASRSIAWIDSNDKCFFPKSIAIDGAGREPLPVVNGSAVLGRENEGGKKEKKRMRAGDIVNLALGMGREYYYKQAEVSSRPSKIRGRGAGPRLPCYPPALPAIQATPLRYVLPVEAAERVGSQGVKLIPMLEGSSVFQGIKNMFLKGMRASTAGLKVVAIRRCASVNSWGALRWMTFGRHTEDMVNLRGEANVRCAWAGGPLPTLEKYALEGFYLKANVPPCVRPYGNGFYLSPQEHGYLSVARTAPDANDSYHVLLCQVLLGKMEAIPYGSPQCTPSNDALFDSGVDDLADPRCYVIWETYIDTRILPEYLITFQIADKTRDMWNPRKKVGETSRKNVGESSAAATEKGVSTEASTGAKGTYAFPLMVHPPNNSRTNCIQAHTEGDNLVEVEVMSSFMVDAIFINEGKKLTSSPKHDAERFTGVTYTRKTKRAK